MTRRAQATLGAVAAIAALGGGCTVTDDHYSVDAFAELTPLSTAGPQITGRLEVLGLSQHNEADFDRAIAAYRVQLPADAAPWIRLWIAPSCETPPDQAMMYQDLGLIRRVGDSVHFFDHDIVIGGRTVDIDVGTAVAGVTLDQSPFGNVFDLLAVAQAPAPDGSATTTPRLGGQTTLVGGAWLACGHFVPDPAD